MKTTSVPTPRKRLSFVNRLLVFLLISVLISSSIVVMFFYGGMGGKMKAYVLEEMESSAAQMSARISSELMSLSRIIYTSVADQNLWQNLVREYENTLEIWQLYSYVNVYSSTIMAMTDNISLVTFYVDNPTIPQDKTYIRQYSEFTDLPIYREVLSRRGAAGLYSMQEVFPDTYYTYNTISDRQNFCLVRASSYRGMDFGVVIEFQKKLFSSALSGLGSHQAYILDSHARIQMHYDGKTEVSGDMYTSLTIKNTQAAKEQELPFQWKMTLVAEMSTLLESINSVFGRMMLFMTLILVTFLAIILTIFLKMTTKVRTLDEKIRSTTVEYGIRPEEEHCARGDEIDQAIYSFDVLKNRVDYLMNEVMSKEIAKRDTELKLLYSQIKPHFLYNTLSSVLSLARRHHDPRLETMVESLSDMYRVSLNQGRENITAADEIALTKSYIYIISNRFDDLLEAEISAEDGIMDTIVPKVIIQPFIENSVGHAMKEDSVLHVRVRGVRNGNEVIFSVQDDGVGITQETVDAIFASDESAVGFGIRNVHRRIQMLYGTQYGVTIAPQAEGGTLVTLRLPYCTAAELPDWQLRAARSGGEGSRTDKYDG